MVLRFAVPTVAALFAVSGLAACGSEPDRLVVGGGSLADQPHPTPAPRPTSDATASSRGDTAVVGTPGPVTTPTAATSPSSTVTVPVAPSPSPRPTPTRVAPPTPAPSRTTPPTTPPAPSPSPSPEPAPYTVQSGSGHSSTSVTASAVEGGGWQWTIVSAGVKQTRGEVAAPLRVHFGALRSDPDAGEPLLDATECVAEVVAPDDRSLVADGTVTVKMLHGDEVLASTAVDITVELAPGERSDITTLSGPTFRPVYDRPVTCSLTFSSRR